MNNLDSGQGTTDRAEAATDIEVQAKQEAPNKESAQREQSASSEDRGKSQDATPAGEPGKDNSQVDARTVSNRQNAQKSTGAKTPEGKAASSKNAIKHGLFAQDLSKYFSGEEFERYQRFIDGLVGDLRPVGDFETVLARRAADIQFRLEMLRAAEFQEYSGGGIVAHSMAAHISKHRDPMALISLYDSRFQRSFKTTMDELRKLQQARRDEEKNAVEQLKDIVLAHIQQNTTFDPAQYGFVISRDLLFNQARLGSARRLAQHCSGNGIAEKKVVDYIASVPKKAA